MLKKRLASVVLLTLGLASCAGIEVQSDYDPETDFASYATYAWAVDRTPAAALGDPRISELLMKRVEEAVDKEMTRKGIRKVEPDEASLLVTRYISVEERVQFNDPYYAFDLVERYEQGTLLIDFIDARSKEMVWRGTGEARIQDSSTPEEREERAMDAVGAILAEFPPGVPTQAVDAEPDPMPAPTESVLVDVPPVAPAAAAQVVVPRPQDPGPGLFNTPDFRRRFAESYIADTDVEPDLTADERETMLEVLDLLSAADAGDEAAARKGMEEAATLLESSKSDAATAVFDFTLANIYSQLEQFDRAVVNYEVAVDKYPKFRRAWGNLGLIHFQQQDYEDAVRVFTRFIELGGADGLRYGLLGISYANLGNYISAETAYRQAAMLDPDTVDWKMGLAETYFKQQRFADAAALGEILIALDPSNARFWMIQGNAYIGLEKPLKAAENFELIDGLGESTVASLTTLGDIYANEGLFDLAVSSYLRALQKDPEADVERALRAGKFLSANGALAETRTLVDGIETVAGDQLQDEDRREILKLRVRVAAAEDATDEEVRILQEIVELDPLDGDALILLGQHYARISDPAQAIFYFERAANVEEFEADAKVRHAQLLVGQGKYDEALPLLRRAQTLQPRDHVQDYLESVERVARSR